MSPLVIFKKAAVNTFASPGWWLLGFFLAGGLHVQWIWPGGYEALITEWLPKITSWFIYWNLHPERAVLPFILLLSAAGAALLLTNGAKVWLLISAAHTHRVSFLGAQKTAVLVGPELTHYIIRLIFRVLPQLIPFSLVTTLTMLVLTTLLAVPLAFGLVSQASVSVYIFVALLAWILVVFVLSVISIVGSYAIILYQRSVFQAVSFSFDLLLKRYQILIRFTVSLLGVYILSYLFGLGVINNAQHVVFFTTRIMAFIAPTLVPAWVIVISALFGLLGVIWISILNVFFNLSFLFFFEQLVTPESLPQPALQTTMLVASTP